jgi:hypothetical protein
VVEENLKKLKIKNKKIKTASNYSRYLADTVVPVAPWFWSCDMGPMSCGAACWCVAWQRSGRV